MLLTFGLYLPGLRLIKGSPYKISGVVNSTEESAKASIEKNHLEDAEFIPQLKICLNLKTLM